MAKVGWISEHAFEDAAIPTRALQDDAVTTGKVVDAAITIDKLDSTLLGYLLPAGRIDYSGVDYSKIG